MCDYRGVIGECEGKPEIEVQFVLNRRDTLHYYRELPLQTICTVCPKHTYELSKDGWRIEQYRNLDIAAQSQFEAAYEEYRAANKQKKTGAWPSAFGSFAESVSDMNLIDPSTSPPEEDDSDFD